MKHDVCYMKNPIERAFELAQSGRFQSVRSIKDQLKLERYDLATVTGGALSSQLRKLIREAQK